MSTDAEKLESIEMLPKVSEVVCDGIDGLEECSDDDDDDDDELIEGLDECKERKAEYYRSVYRGASMM